MNKLERFLQAGKLLFDGAIGSELYYRGASLNDSFEGCNISRPHLVEQLHADYLAAGATVLTGNTFAANRPGLTDYGLADSLVDINRQGIELVKRAVAKSRREPQEILIAASIGPLSAAKPLPDGQSVDEITALFAEQMAAILAGRPDCILLETFTQSDELAAALQAAKDVPLPLIVTVSSNRPTLSDDLKAIQPLLQLADTDKNVRMIGINCGKGPEQIYYLIQKTIKKFNKPFLAMPNAGAPQRKSGRNFYLTNPDYFRGYASRYLQIGCAAVGGCCGTNADDIMEVSYLLSSERAKIGNTAIQKIVQTNKTEKSQSPATLKNISRLGAKLQTGATVKTVELLPPRGCSLEKFISQVKKCRQAGIDSINIPDGPRASARLSAFQTAAGVEHESGLESILHITCRDRNLIALQADLLAGKAIGLKNILAVTGDPPKLGNYPSAQGVFDIDAVGLTGLIASLNSGFDAAGEKLPSQTNYLIGVGANPAALSIDNEIAHLKNKLAAGAHFIMTQPVFKAEILLRFLERAAVDVPVIAGVWPLYSYNNALFLKNEVPGIDLPAAVIERMEKCRGKEEGITEGVAIAREIKESIAAAVGGFQVSAPFNKVEIAFRVLAD